MKPTFTTSEPDKSPISPRVFSATDTTYLLSSLRQLGSGRIICNHGPLSLVVTTDFRAMHPRGCGFKFSSGLIELNPECFQVLVSTASCGLGLGISLIDHQNNLRTVFHFCHNSPWRNWLENHTQSGLLQSQNKHDPAPANLCWCELWPQPNADISTTPPSLLEKRLNIIINSRTIEATIHSHGLDLTAVIHPSSFDILSSSVRFWDRPRTRVCYTDLSSLDPQQHPTYVGLHS